MKIMLSRTIFILVSVALLSDNEEQNERLEALAVGR
jgi:hypothetical protein